MHIFGYVIRINIHNEPKFRARERDPAFLEFLIKSMVERKKHLSFVIVSLSFLKL